MKRCLGNFLTVLSLLLAVGTAALWVESVWYDEGVSVVTRAAVRYHLKNDPW